MAAIQLSYSSFGLTNLDFLEAIDAVDRAGYAGIELAFHREQFNPFNLDVLRPSASAWTGLAVLDYQLRSRETLDRREREHVIVVDNRAVLDFNAVGARVLNWPQR